MQKKVAAIGTFICPTLLKERRVETIAEAKELIGEDATCFFCKQLSQDCEFGIKPD